jgi:hypothetical protein
MRCRWSRRPRSIPTAYTEAIVKPVTMYAASSMCTTCGQVDGPNIAAHGWASTTRPSSSSRKPVGLFIQALAATTKKAPAAPDTIIGSALSMCARGERRFQPNR